MLTIDLRNLNLDLNGKHLYVTSDLHILASSGNTRKIKNGGVDVLGGKLTVEESAWIDSTVYVRSDGDAHGGTLNLIGGTVRGVVVYSGCAFNLTDGTFGSHFDVQRLVPRGL